MGIENKKFIESSEKKIKSFLQDYANDFIALNRLLMVKEGIKTVRKVIKDGYKILTLEEYFIKLKEEKRETLSEEDKKDPIFIEKAKLLNELANKVNLLGEEIEEDVLKEITQKVNNIIYK